MPLPYRQTHGNLPSAFEGDDSLPKTISVAVGLLTVFVSGLWLIVRGLM